MADLEDQMLSTTPQADRSIQNLAVPARAQTFGTPNAKRSCKECRRRKIRCNRALPCAYCTKINIECIYEVQRPSFSRPAASGRQSTSSGGSLTGTGGGRHEHNDHLDIQADGVTTSDRGRVSALMGAESPLGPYGAPTRFARPSGESTVRSPRFLFSWITGITKGVYRRVMAL